MKKIFKLMLITIFLFFSSSNLQSFSEERIIFFSSAISISDNGTLTIHETLAIECLNQEIKHGIYRDLPLYDNQNKFLLKPLGKTTWFRNA